MNRVPACATIQEISPGTFSQAGQQITWTIPNATAGSTPIAYRQQGQVWVLARLTGCPAGNISATHGRAVEQIPDARVSAVYSPTFAKAEQLAAAHGAAPYDSLERFFEGERLDAVIVGTPSGLHAEHGIAASRRGVHVLVEKPIDVTTAAADTLIAETARAGVTLGVIFQDRLKPAMRELKTLVDEGALGRVLLARADVPWWRPPEYYRGSRGGEPTRSTAVAC